MLYLLEVNLPFVPVVFVSCLLWWFCSYIS